MTIFSPFFIATIKFLYTQVSISRDFNRRKNYFRLQKPFSFCMLRGSASFELPHGASL